MFQYVLLDDDPKFLSQVDVWKKGGVTSIAMDFEGEFNLHIYGEHLCLIQLFDGSSFFLADPFKLSAEALKVFFEDKELEKVMFSCESDASLVRKEYDIQLMNVYDVRVPAMELGYMGNLSGLMDLYHLEHGTENKKKNQMENWLTRPLPEKQLQYALGDVAQLLNLKTILEAETVKNKKVKDVRLKMKNCAMQKNPERPGWEKLPSYKFMNKQEKAYVKHFFLERDGIAKRRNVPASRILDKHLLVDLAKKAADGESWLPEVPTPGLQEALGRAAKSANAELMKS
jgi:ribonuclease D